MIYKYIYVKNYQRSVIELDNSSVSVCRLPSQHQFWAHAPVEEEVENAELLAESSSRYISFPGSFTPISHFCRARLDNGLLCQRQDRLKVAGQTKQQTKRLSCCNCSVHLVFVFLQCPFHGRIIPRDKAGLPINEEDRLREEQEARRKKEEQTGEQTLIYALDKKREIIVLTQKNYEV